MGNIWKWKKVGALDYITESAKRLFADDNISYNLNEYLSIHEAKTYSDVDNYAIKVDNTSSRTEMVKSEFPDLFDNSDNKDYELE